MVQPVSGPPLHSAQIATIATADTHAVLTGDYNGVGRIREAIELFSLRPSSQHLCLSEAGTHRVLSTWKGHTRSITQVAYGSVCNAYVSGSRDGSAMLWREGQQYAVSTYHAHEAALSGLTLDHGVCGVLGFICTECTILGQFSLPCIRQSAPLHRVKG